MGMTNNNLCNSCTNIGCEFQSGIVRTECAFYMPPHIEPDNCGNYVVMQPTVETIPKVEIQKALKEGSKDISEKVLAIVREEYISKADYETRLKADMVVMLEELKDEAKKLRIQKARENVFGREFKIEDYDDIIQSKIDKLKGE